MAQVKSQNGKLVPRNRYVSDKLTELASDRDSGGRQTHRSSNPNLA